MSHYDPFDIDTQDTEATAKAERTALLEQREIDDFKWFLSDKRGRRILWRLLSSTGVFRSSHTGNALQTAFLEGQRQIGLELFAQAHRLCPNRYAEMAQENS